MNSNIITSLNYCIKGKPESLNDSLMSIVHNMSDELELIIVTDDRKFREKINVRIAKNVKVLYFRGKKNDARNLAYLNSKGEYVFFIDHDMILNKGLISELNALKSFDAFYVNERGVDDGRLISKIYTLEKEIVHGDINSETPRIFKKYLFSTKYLPFDNIYGASDEWGFSIRLNNIKHTTSRLKNNVEISFKNINLFKSLKKKYDMGKSSSALSRNSGNIIVQRENIIKRGIILYIKKNRLFWKHPLVFSLFLLVKVIEYIAYYVGKLSS